MDYEKYHVYLIEGDGPLAKIAAYEAERHESRAAGEKFAKENGGTSLILLGRTPYGIALAPDGKPRNGWKVAKKHALPDTVIAIPDGRTKAGKLLDKTIRAMPEFSTTSLARRLGAGAFVMGGASPTGGVYCYESHVIKEQQHWILLRPKDGDKPAPAFDGCRLLKLSEFYAIKEATEAAAA